MTKGTPWYGEGAQPPPNQQSGYNYGYSNQYNASGYQYQNQEPGQYGHEQGQNQYGQNYQQGPGYQQGQDYQQDQNYQQGSGYQQGYNYQQGPGYGQGQNYQQESTQNHGSVQWNQSQDQSYGQYYTPYPPSHGSEVEQFKAHFDQQSSVQGQSNDYYNPQQTHSLPNQPEEERGVLGALGGGAAGAFAGHKMGHHGILGALGGAIAGSLLEDQTKKHKKDDKHEEDKKHKEDKRRSHSPEHRGNFSASSANIWLEHDQYLVAECKDVNGHAHQSRIDLNDCLGNDNGEFRWVRHGNFKASAKDIKLKDDGTKLKAKLATVHGDWEEDSIKLDERIGNDNGRLFFIE